MSGTKKVLINCLPNEVNNQKTTYGFTCIKHMPYTCSDATVVPRFFLVVASGTQQTTERNCSLQYRVKVNHISLRKKNSIDPFNMWAVEGTDYHATSQSQSEVSTVLWLGQKVDNFSFVGCMGCVPTTQLWRCTKAATHNALVNEPGCVNKLYLRTLKLEFHIIFICHEIGFSCWFFFFNHLTMLRSFLAHTIQKQVVGCIWSVGSNPHPCSKHTLCFNTYFLPAIR